MTEYNDAYPDPKHVCPGCGGYQEDTETYKCAYCRSEKERGV